MTRYIDAQNFYYLVVAPDGSIQIREIVNGVFGPLAVTPFNFVVGRNYRLRLEAIGTWLRAYVDGRLVLETRDTTHAAGKAGLWTYKTSVDYDNVIVSSGPATELLQDTFSQTDEETPTPWATSPAGVWTHTTTSTGATVWEQSSSSIESGTGRAINGAPAADQIVSVDIKPLEFNSAGTPVVGVIARYVDAGSYYYALLNSWNTVTLSKLVNNSIHVFEEVPMTVTPGTTYRLRLEAIGSALRLYVNGQLMAEAVDSDYPTGRYGLKTYRTAAQFDNFSAIRP